MPGAKVGGVGDVVRSLPVALAERGWRPAVLVPSYGSLHNLPGARLQAEFAVDFAGAARQARLWRVPGPDPRVEQLVVDHPLLAPQGPGQVYCHDDDSQPFATDATKFAFFCAALGEYLLCAERLPQIVHLHDWHTGLYLALRAAVPRLARLREVRTVYTIHNLAMQGIRPVAGHASALRSWFPDIDFDMRSLQDPRYLDCINPMAIGIRMADAVNTVSPTYAREILRPSEPALGFFGGEGLEADLQEAHAAGRLTGILNGCDYPPRPRRRPGWQRLVAAMAAQVQSWQQAAPHPASAAALERLTRLPRRRPAAVLVSVGRLTPQKVQLFLQADPAGNRAIDTILQRLGACGVMLMLGSGDAGLEAEFSALMGSRPNFVFLRGYSAALSEQLYSAGDLFLMPSSFEPCGISQMFAMRAGQPCVVHGVGGLADTVDDGRTGFVFGGTTPAVQAEQFIAAVDRAVEMKRSAP
ncbi:MAG: glycogen/starch synthase, partial [Gammaproteobacteria bacterium]|nr:glycogen/starch synthase [Gammaproteobacteria bacterium]